jgi:hypothetical protein
MARTTAAARRAPAKPKAKTATPTELAIHKAIRKRATARLEAAGIGPNRPATMLDLAITQVSVELALSGLKAKMLKASGRREQTTVTRYDSAGRILSFIKEPIE